MMHLEERDSVSVVRLEHGKANALDLELLKALRQRLDDLPADARGLVLTGTDAIFSAGIDLPRLLAEGESYVNPLIASLDALLDTLVRLPLPVIAAINGHAIAGGYVLACACDLRLMADGAGKVGLTELRVGVPFPPRVLGIVRGVVAERELREMVYRGRLYSPKEAVQRGMVDELVSADELLDKAIETARELAAVSPRAFELTKRQLMGSTLQDLDRLGTSFAEEVRLIWEAESTRERIRRFVQERFG